MDIKEVINRLNDGETQQSIAEQLGVSQAGISQAVRRFFKKIKYCPHCHKPIIPDNKEV